MQENDDRPSVYVDDKYVFWGLVAAIMVATYTFILAIHGFAEPMRIFGAN